MNIAIVVSTKDFTNNIVLFDNIQDCHSRLNGVMARWAGCYTKGPEFESWIRHGCQTLRPKPHQWLNSKLVDGRCQVHSSVALVDVAIRSFPWFSPNSSKYELRSLRKTPTEGIPPIVPGPTSGQLDSYQQPTNQPDRRSWVRGSPDEKSPCTLMAPGACKVRC